MCLFFFLSSYVSKECLGHSSMNHRGIKSKNKKVDDCFGRSDPEAFRQNITHYLTEKVGLILEEYFNNVTLLYALESQFSFKNKFFSSSSCQYSVGQAHTRFSRTQEKLSSHGRCWILILTSGNIWEDDLSDEKRKCLRCSN